jgi:hypothetical protein
MFSISDGSDAVEVLQTVRPGDNEEISMWLGRQGKLRDVYEDTTWMGDTNGMQLVTRRHDRHRPIGGNTYPVCRMALANMMENSSSGNANALLFSHVHGVSSPSTGTLQMMVHRRGTGGEFPPLGMSVPLNDTVVVRDVSWWLMSSGSAIVEQAMTAQTRLEHPPIISYGGGHDGRSSTLQRQWRGMKASLPPFVTLEYLGAIEPSAQVRVLRLLYLPPPLNSTMSSQTVAVTVNLADTFDFAALKLKVSTAQEVTLSTMMTVEKENATRWPPWIEQHDPARPNAASSCGAFDHVSMSICLAPGQTRTLAFHSIIDIADE